MPLYEYLCKECEEKFEELRSPSQADTDVSCPDCGSPKVSRQFSTFAAGSGSPGGGAARSSGGCGPRGFT